MTKQLPPESPHHGNGDSRRVPTFEALKWSGPFVLPDIREAIGLDSDEKVFLYDLASHANFTEESAEERILQRNGFGRHIFERVRKSLSERGLIEITYRKGDTNLYKLKVGELKRFPKAHSRAGGYTNGADASPVGPNSGGTPAGLRPRKLNRAAAYTKTWPPSGLSDEELRELDAEQKRDWRTQTKWAEGASIGPAEDHREPQEGSYPEANERNEDTD